MRPHINPAHVSGVIPSGLTGHVVRYQLPVDAEVLETDVFYLPFLVISLNHRDLRTVSGIGNILEEHILYAAPNTSYYRRYAG